MLFLFSPASIPMLFTYSLSSSLIATMISYFLNFHWTFRPEGKPQHWKRFRRFALFACFSIVICQSIFLFILHTLKPYFHIDSYFLPNLAKFIGVTISAFVNFMNYKMGVFYHEELKRFRFHFNFKINEKKNLWTLCSIAFLCALICRIGYLFFTTTVYGDGVHYAEIGFQISKGEFALVDRFWMNLFCFWEAFIYLFVKNPITGAMVAGIIPGSLMVIPVFWLGKILFNSRVGFLAALIIAFHPRLIAFSCNSYSEIFYIFLICLGVLCLTFLLKRGSEKPWLALCFGACFGAYVGVRGEGIVLYLAMLPTLFFIPRRGIHLISSLFGFGSVLALYALLSFSLLGSPSLGQKKMVLTKTYSEQLDYRLSAKEDYEEGGLAFNQEENVDWKIILKTLMERVPLNILYAMERLPGVLLTPLIFFLFLLPISYHPKPSDWLSWTPLLLMFVFPLVFYTLIQIEPRYFFTILIPVHIFGFAGLFAALSYSYPRHLTTILTSITLGIILYLIPLTIWVGVSTERKYEIDQVLSAWIKTHVPPNEKIAGDGFGYISTTAFLADRLSIPRLWTKDPSRLASFMREQKLHWLILYEPFIRENNPELINILDQGIPEMTKVYETKDKKGMRYQIYRI